MTDEKKRGRKTIDGDKNAIRYLGKLQSFREQEHLSQSKLATLSGVSDKLIRDIELHHINLAHVSVASYTKLAAFFQWSNEEENPSLCWRDTNSASLKIHASKMYNLLSKIASENEVWTVGEVRRLLASISKS